MLYFWIGNMETCILFPNIFSHSVSCLSIFLTVSFDEQKFSILMKLNFSNFFFSCSCFRCHIEFEILSPGQDQ